jgi:hypothetical protein
MSAMAFFDIRLATPNDARLLLFSYSPSRDPF